MIISSSVNDDSSNSLPFQTVAWFPIWQEALDLLRQRVQRDFNYLWACLKARSDWKNRRRQRERGGGGGGGEGRAVT